MNSVWSSSKSKHQAKRSEKIETCCSVYLWPKLLTRWKRRKMWSHSQFFSSPCPCSLFRLLFVFVWFLAVAMYPILIIAIIVSFISCSTLLFFDWNSFAKMFVEVISERNTEIWNDTHHHRDGNMLRMCVARCVCVCGSACVCEHLRFPLKSHNLNYIDDVRCEIASDCVPF